MAAVLKTLRNVFDHKHSSLVSLTSMLAESSK